MSSAADSHRLFILEPEDVQALYGLPRLTDDERQLYFDLGPRELEAVQARTPSVGAYLVLELGYFKAKCQFFVFEPAEVAEDLQYLLTKYLAAYALDSIRPPSATTRTAIQRWVLELVGFRYCDAAAYQALQDKAARIAMLSTQPMYILRESLQYLTNERIIAPKYTTLQDMIGRVVTHERNRVSTLLQKSMPAKVARALDELLAADEQFYRISALKREPKDFSHKELKQEVERRQQFEPLHDFARTFLIKAALSNDSVKYYASLVKFYSVYKLQQMPRASARLYLLCFAFHRFRQISDNLIESFVHLVEHYEQQAKQAGEEAMNQALLSATENLHAAGDVLRLFIDPSIATDARFADVQTKAFGLLERDQFPAVADHLRNIAFDKTAYQWSQYTQLSRTFKLNLRHLFCELDFGGRVEDAPLLQAVTFLQKLLRAGQSPRDVKPEAFPRRLIPKHLRPYLYHEGKVRANRLDVDRYEFLIYRLLCQALQAGDVFVEHSNEFRRFEHDLISDERWAHRDAVLAEIGAPLLLAPIEDTLSTFREAVRTRFADVNRRILEATNEHIKIRGRGEKRRWSLIYPTAEELTNSPFYGQLPGIGIADLLWFVAGGTGFLNTFTHVLERYVKQAPDARQILACIVALGTNMGLSKMAEVSGISFASLQGTARNYLRLETLRAANDAISNATAKLPAFKLYNIGDKLHSSSDGQRFQTQTNTFNARHSPKYFGLEKGVSACTVVVNHLPINGRIIGAQEHESHYVFDLLYNNTSDIKPERHSTDTHGTNQVNFWTLRVYGYGFAPRYRDLYKKALTLVGFDSPSTYGDEMLIRPSRKVNEDLIIKEWPNIQRIMASLGQKDVTQATIVRKLSSYLRQNQTKRALWELEDICRTLYILDFIDDVDLRQAVQKALNRGEAYHRFRRAVAYVLATV